jgi:hypothetical protein
MVNWRWIIKKTPETFVPRVLILFSVCF